VLDFFYLKLCPRSTGPLIEPPRPEATSSEESQPLTNIDERPPRARAIVEFIDGDLSRPPVVYPQGGSAEVDAAMCDAILIKWGALQK